MSMHTNGTRSPDEIQADIERTRSELQDTLSAIEQRMTPSQLIDQGVDYLRHSGAREYISNLGESAKQEPIPLALVGVGLAWLMLSSGRESRTTGHVTADDLAARARASADSVADGVRGTISSVRDTAARTSHRIGDTAHRIGDTAHAARERASQLSAAARERAVQMRHGYERMVNDHPLALGAVGLAVGAVLAAATPRTREEDRLMGHASERMKNTAREAGKEQLDRAASALHTAAEDAERSADRSEVTSPAAPPPAPEIVTSPSRPH